MSQNKWLYFTYGTKLANVEITQMVLSLREHTSKIQFQSCTTKAILGILEVMLADEVLWSILRQRSVIIVLTARSWNVEMA